MAARLTTAEIRMHVARVLTLATYNAIMRPANNTSNYQPGYNVYELNNWVGYSFIQWHEEYKNYCSQWDDSPERVNATVEEVSDALVAMGFPQ